jgi:hypothetical protein
MLVLAEPWRTVFPWQSPPAAAAGRGRDASHVVCRASLVPSLSSIAHPRHHITSTHPPTALQFHSRRPCTVCILSTTCFLRSARILPPPPAVTTNVTRRARRVVLLSLHSFQGRQFAACTPTHALANAHVAARSSLSHRLRARTNPPDRHRISLRRPSQIDLARQRHFFTQPAVLNQTRRPHQESTQSNRKPSIIQPLQQVSTSSHRIQTDNAFPINDDVNNGV